MHCTISRPYLATAVLRIQKGEEGEQVEKANPDDPIAAAALSTWLTKQTSENVLGPNNSRVLFFSILISQKRIKNETGPAEYCSFCNFE